VAVAFLARGEVLVEGGQGDDADAARRLAIADRNDRFLGGLLVERDLPADQADGIVEAPAENVGQGAIPPLADADDAVADLQLAGKGSRAAGNELADCRVFLFFLEQGADTD